MSPAALFDLTGRVALVPGGASGSIVNIGSIASMTAMGRGHIAYVMAMGAVVQTRKAPNGGRRMRWITGDPHGRRQSCHECWRLRSKMTAAVSRKFAPLICQFSAISPAPTEKADEVRGEIPDRPVPDLHAADGRSVFRPFAGLSVRA